MMTRNAVLLLLLAAPAACQRPPAADLVVYGHVWTGDPEKPWAQAVAVVGDTVMLVGDSAEVVRHVGPKTRVIANGDGLVAPGFNDAHTHTLSGGYVLAGVDLRSANSPQEFVARLKAFASERQPGEWILGGTWDHERWPGAPLPRRDWIDSVTPRNPVFIERLDGHMGLANSLALRAAGITRATPSPAGGLIVKDPRTGEPTGILKDDAMSPLYRAVPNPTPEQDDAALIRALGYIASKGVTGIGAVSAPWSEVSAFKRARAAGRLTVRVSLYPALDDWHRVADTVSADGAGDDWIRLDGVKGYVDGSLGSTTALFYEPYNDAPGMRGLLVTPEDSLRAWIGAADSAGLQIAVHAIGERANGLILDIYDSVARAHGQRDRRFRIEHAQHLRREDMDRIAALGVVASMQPYHVIDDGRWAEKRVGPERIKHMYVFRSLLNRSAHLAFGSDWTVAPMDPILGIYAAVTRRTLDGKNPEGWIPEEKITVEEALRAYTYEDAYAVFGEAHRGMLRPGYLADIVLVDRDLTKIPPVEIQNARIRATIVGGRAVYEDSGTGGP